MIKLLEIMFCPKAGKDHLPPSPKPWIGIVPKGCF